jgi:hypothetical protein
VEPILSTAIPLRDEIMFHLSTIHNEQFLLGLLAIIKAFPVSPSPVPPLRAPRPREASLRHRLSVLLLLLPMLPFV